MSVKLPDNLPNQAEAINKAEVFAANSKQLEQFNQHMADVVKNGISQFQNQHPDSGKKLGYTYQGHAYVRKPGTHQILSAIMRLVAYPGGLNKTKKEILDEVKTQLPQHRDSVNYNVWYRKLKPAQWTKMQQVISGNLAKPVSIKGCKTLSDIRNKLIAESAKRAASFTTTVTVTIDVKTVVIGEEIYAISVRKSKGKEYPSIRVGKKRMFINVTALREALQK